jgi:NAD(P)-dependent dehydrogenase (short-subunit alcohol dehydrogenase family)
MNFQGLDVVVTGGAGALGAAVVERLLAAGATCHLPLRADTVPESLSNLGHSRLRVASGVDLTDEAAVESFYGSLPTLWASLHAAGGFAMVPIADLSRAQIEHLWQVNALSCFLCCREAVKAMRAKPAAVEGVTGGRIVNVTARPALEPRGGAGMSAYAASKAAVAALTQALGQVLATEGIWVNAVAPSIIDTPANRAAIAKADHSRWPKPHEIAETMAFLAAPNNATARGAVIPVYGRS